MVFFIICTKQVSSSLVEGEGGCGSFSCKGRGRMRLVCPQRIMDPFEHQDDTEDLEGQSGTC